MMEASTAWGKRLLGAGWSNGSSAHCSREALKGNLTRHARARALGGQYWRSASGGWVAGTGGIEKAAGMPGRASWWQAEWCIRMALCHLWLSLFDVCSEILKTKQRSKNDQSFRILKSLTFFNTMIYLLDMCTRSFIYHMSGQMIW